MTNKEKLAITCAYLDLKGSLECHESGEPYDHDWEAHRLSIKELEEVFDFLTDSENKSN